MTKVNYYKLECTPTYRLNVPNLLRNVYSVLHGDRACHTSGPEKHTIFKELCFGVRSRHPIRFKHSNVNANKLSIRRRTSKLYLNYPSFPPCLVTLFVVGEILILNKSIVPPPAVWKMTHRFIRNTSY